MKAHIYYYNQINSDQRNLLHGDLKMAVNARSLKYLLGWLIAGTRGGPTRAKIIDVTKRNSAERKSTRNAAENGL